MDFKSWETFDELDELIEAQHRRICFYVCMVHIANFTTVLKRTHGLQGEHRKYVKMYEKKTARSESKTAWALSRTASALQVIKFHK